MAKLAATVAALLLTASLCAFSPPTAAADSSVPPYSNHTVGDHAGWFFNASTNSSAANYSSWAATQSFYLGDYLIFNTNSNLTVVQTTNATTYGRCSADEDDGRGTFVYDDGGDGAVVATVIAVPLTVEGDNYFFSDAGDDGVQCSHGMRFHIVVQHGLGLPASLNHPPPPPPYAEPPPATAPPEGDSKTAQSEQYYNGGGRRRGAVGFGGLVLGAMFLMV